MLVVYCGGFSWGGFIDLVVVMIFVDSGGGEIVNLFKIGCGFGDGFIGFV